jgi:hypothetical protein
MRSQLPACSAALLADDLDDGGLERAPFVLRSVARLASLIA